MRIVSRIDAKARHCVKDMERTTKEIGDWYHQSQPLAKAMLGKLLEKHRARTMVNLLTVHAYLIFSLLGVYPFEQYF